jgi:hypothetical protein
VGRFSACRRRWCDRSGRGALSARPSHGLKSYDVLDYVKGRCNGHLLRRCRDLVKDATTAEQPWLEPVAALLREAIDVARRRDTLTPVGYARRVTELKNRLHA